MAVCQRASPPIVAAKSDLRDDTAMRDSAHVAEVMAAGDRDRGRLNRASVRGCRSFGNNAEAESSSAVVAAWQYEIMFALWARRTSDSALRRRSSIRSRYELAEDECVITLTMRR